MDELQAAVDKIEREGEEAALKLKIRNLEKRLSYWKARAKAAEEKLEERDYIWT